MRFLFVAVVGLAVALSDMSFAYIGPGTGLGAFGTVIALTAAILLAVVGFVWYPLKRILLKRKSKLEPKTDTRGPGKV
jgi:hypothetical protein